MAKSVRNSSGGITWTLESAENAPLSEKLAELRVIFRHYARKGVESAFLLELMEYQAEYLERAAKKQEAEMSALKKQLEALRKDVEDMKNPPVRTLDKKPRVPK